MLGRIPRPSLVSLPRNKSQSPKASLVCSRWAGRRLGSDGSGCLLLEELSLKQASALAAKICNSKKKKLYQAALALKSPD
jgi:16S rRNA C1402 (ribose-2'-O) methylase RsmI